MTVASEITRIEGNISAAYTAANTKGATMPVTENSDNLATCIASISSGYTEFPSYQVVNGVASRQNGTAIRNEFSDITSIDSYGLYEAFAHCDFNSVAMPNLITIGESGLYGTFGLCPNLTSASFGNLKTINDSGMYSTFAQCLNLNQVYFWELNTIKNQGMAYCFFNCLRLQDVYFYALTSSSFNTGSDHFKNMLSYVGSGVTLHFPSGLQSTIQNLSGYPNFGGTSGYVTIAYDL